MAVNGNQLRANWRIMIDRIPVVSVSIQTSLGIYTSKSLYESWYRDRGLSEAESSLGGYLVRTVDWFYPIEMNPGTELVPGDVISYQSKSYTVGPDGVQLVGAMGAWKCSALCPQLNVALDQTISVKRYTTVQDSQGYIKRGNAFTYVAQDVPCRIQDADTFGVVAVGTSETLGKLQNPQLSNIFLSSVVRVQPHDEIVASDGRIFTFEADANVNRLGQFMSLQCKRLL